MDRCAVEEATNKMMEQNSKEDKAIESFFAENKQDIKELKNTIERLLLYAENYHGYDLREYLIDEIKEVL